MWKNTKMFEIISEVKYHDEALHQRVKQAADKKFGSKSSYVKSLWIIKEYKSRGGKVQYKGKKPSTISIKKQVKGSQVILNVSYQVEEDLFAAEHNGKKVHLNKPFRTPSGPKKFAVYTKNGSGKVVIVRFGDPNMEIKRDDPARRKSFRARHHCENPGPKWKAQYWACQTWRSDKSVKQVAGEEEIDWDNLPTQEEIYGSELPLFDIEEIDDSCYDCA
jgi:hypothetical protein